MPDADPLALDRETMRSLGYRTVDMLVERLADETIPPLRRATPAEMAERLGGPTRSGPSPPTRSWRGYATTCSRS